MNKLFSAVGVLALLFSNACRDPAVVNPNPEIEPALPSPEEVEALAISTMNSWYLTSTRFYPYLMVQTTADALTSNFCMGTRFNNLEPRIPYENHSAGGDREVAGFPWDNNYATLGDANDVLRAVKKGLVVRNASETEKTRHIGQLTQALTLTNLALLFDRAFILDEDTDPTAPPPELRPFTEVAAAASVRWDVLITDLAGKSHVYADTVFPSTPALTSSTMLRFANTMHALLLGYTPRSSDQVPAVNWGKVLTLTANGINFDLQVQGDQSKWYSYINYYGNERSWMRVDHRVIHRMNPSYQFRFEGTIQAAGSSSDARYGTDYVFLNNVIGDPARGVYMQSAWYHDRYSHHAQRSPTSGRTLVPYVLKAENDLLRAEALIRSGGSLAEAADLINITRVGRGGLPPASAGEGAATLLEHIDYERDIELLNTNGFSLFQRRHVTPETCTPRGPVAGAPAAGRHQLQVGTVRHLPIPAKELETLGLPIYTFGGSCTTEQ